MRVKTIKLAALTVVLTVLTTGCFSSGVPQNQIGLHYSGGLEDKKCVKVIEPGQGFTLTGIMDSVVKLPASQRTWNGDTAPSGELANGADTHAIEVVSQDGVRLKVPFTLNFRLNREKEQLCEFWNQIGSKTNAATDEGWNEMLFTYFDPQIQRGFESVALQYDWRDLWGDEVIRAEFARAAAEQAKTNINEIVGGDYFCGPALGECAGFTLAVGKPTPMNDDIIAQVEAEQTATAATQTLDAENARIDAELRGRRQQVELYGPEVYAYLQAVEAAKAAGAAPPPFIPPGASADVLLQQLGR